MLPNLLAHGGPMLWLILIAGAAGIAVFAFFARYIWGSRLQRASRRAVAALIAGK